MDGFVHLAYGVLGALFLYKIKGVDKWTALGLTMDKKKEVFGVEEGVRYLAV